MEVAGEVFVGEGEGGLLVGDININAEEANKIINIAVKLLREVAL